MFGTREPRLYPLNNGMRSWSDAIRKVIDNERIRADLVALPAPRNRLYAPEAMLQADDAVWGNTSHLGAGGTIKGKKAAEEWLRKWLEEFPKRNIVVKSVCFAAWPLSPANVVMVDWTAEETSRDGKEFKYDGVSVTHVKNRNGT